MQTPVTSVAEAAVFGLFEYGIEDPNSQYLPPRVLDRLSEEQTGTISGIGRYRSGNPHSLSWATTLS